MSPAGPTEPLTVVLLTTDNRWVHRDYLNPVPHFGPAPAALIEGFTNLPGIRVHIVSSTNRLMTSPEKLADNIWFHSQYVSRMGWMRTGFMGCIRATRKTLRRIHPDIVHGQGTESDCAMSAVFSHFPNLLTVHGNMRRIAKVESHPYNWLAGRLERFVLPRSLGVVCLTTHTERQVGTLAKRTWIVPNAVDPSFFEIDSQPDPGIQLILCVATISALKNQIGLIRSLDGLGDKRKLEIIFLGGGEPSSPYCLEFRRMVESRPWCRYEGYADREQLKRYLRTATLFVLPSLEENCPMVILEAMAAGVPVLAARVGGVPDLFEEGKTGFFCDPLQENSMRAAVQTALSDSAVLRQIATRAKQEARERFHPKVIARKHLHIYRQVLERLEKDCSEQRGFVKQ